MDRLPETPEASGAGARCVACGAYVSHRFALVFGDNDGTVDGCIECSTLRELTRNE